MYDAIDDPYTYENSTVLVNKLDLRNQDQLDAYEAEISNARSGDPLPEGDLDFEHYCAVHHHLFQDVYTWAGKPRTVRLSKQGNPFCYPEHIEAQATKLFAELKAQEFIEDLEPDDFSTRAAHFLSELNAIDAFREGNGRTQLTFLAMLADNAGHALDLEKLDPDVMLNAMIESFEGDERQLVPRNQGSYHLSGISSLITQCRVFRIRGALPLIAIACGFAAIDPAMAAPCSFQQQGEGREIRLAGIEPVASEAANRTAALSAIVAGHAVTLHGEDDTPDRYGRQPAFVFLDGSGNSVQAMLLEQGEALASAGVADKDCAAALLAAETAAREAKRGTWAGPAVIKNAESPGDILAGNGRFMLVEGRVLSVRQAGATTYLNFGRNWTRDFAVTISRRSRASFEAAGIAPKSLENRRIRVRGFISGSRLHRDANRAADRSAPGRTDRVAWRELALQEK